MDRAVKANTIDGDAWAIEITEARKEKLDAQKARLISSLEAKVAGLTAQKAFYVDAGNDNMADRMQANIENVQARLADLA